MLLAWMRGSCWLVLLSLSLASACGRADLLDAEPARPNPVGLADDGGNDSPDATYCIRPQLRCDPSNCLRPGCTPSSIPPLDATTGPGTRVVRVFPPPAFGGYAHDLGADQTGRGGLPPRRFWTSGMIRRRPEEVWGSRDAPRCGSGCGWLFQRSRMPQSDVPAAPPALGGFIRDDCRSLLGRAIAPCSRHGRGLRRDSGQ